MKALPEEYAYDFKTADETYVKINKIKKWMQFPDSQFISARIASLEAQLKAFREAAEPFEEAASNLPDPYCDASRLGELRDFDLWESPAAMNIKASDLIRIRALMSALQMTEKKDG